jgi:hypothetical protein
MEHVYDCVKKEEEEGEEEPWKRVGLRTGHGEAPPDGQTFHRSHSGPWMFAALEGYHQFSLPISPDPLIGKPDNHHHAPDNGSETEQESAGVHEVSHAWPRGQEEAHPAESPSGVFGGMGSTQRLPSD